MKPEVTLGEYKGLEVPKSETEVTDEEIEAELKKEQEKNSEPSLWKTAEQRTETSPPSTSRDL